MPTRDEFLRHLIDSVPDAIVVTDRGGQIQFASRACESMFGYTRAELVSQPIEILVPLARDAAHVAAREAFSRDPVPRTMGTDRPLTARRKDGSELPVDVSLGVLPEGGAGAFIAVVRDASARTAAESKHRDAEERFRLAFDQAPIGMALVELDGRFGRVNDALCAILGYTRDELTRLTFQTITHPEDLDVDLQLAGRLARGEIPSYQLAKRYIRKDGVIVDAFLTGSVVRSAAGAPLYYIAQIEDVTERKREAEIRRLSETRYRDLVEHAPDGVFVADLDGRYTDVNVAACHMLGYSRDELVGRTIADVLAPGELPRLEAAREELLVPGALQVAEWSLLRKDGTPVPVEVSAAILGDGRWQAFVRDISARKHAEQALLRSEESLSRAQRVAHVGSFDWDLEANTAVRSAELCALFGLGPETGNAPPGSLTEMWHRDDREDVLRVLDEVKRTGGAYRREHRIVRHDGSERLVLHQGEGVTENGRVVRIVGTLLDITERKRIENEREESLRLLTAVLEQCPVGIVLAMGAHGEHVQFNARAQQLTARSADEAERDADLLFTPDGRPLARDDRPVARALRGERMDGVELLLRAPGGNLTPIAVSAAPVLDARGAVGGAVVAFADVTATKELERLRAEWASIVAHDLRQPLNSIALHGALIARTIARGPGGPIPGVTQATDTIARATGRMNRMIDDLLDLSRLEARRLHLARGSTDLVALAQAVIDARGADEAGPRVELRVEGSIPHVNVDPDRIAQVIENLLSNATKYGSAEEPIVMEIGGTSDAVHVAVSNAGPGIAAEDLPRLFARFVRSEEAERSHVKGIGLGLHICRELVTAHGGEIVAESIQGGRTTFRFTLPTSAPAAPRRAADASTLEETFAPH